MRHATIIALGCLGLALVCSAPGEAGPKTGHDSKANEPKNAEYNFRVLETRVDFEFDNVPIAKVLAQLSEEHRTKFVLGNEWQGKDLYISAKLKNVKLGKALDLSLGWAPWMRPMVIVIGDTIVIASESSALSMQLEQDISVHVDQVPLEKVIRGLAKQYGVNVVVDPLILKTKAAEAPITLSVEETPFEAVVARASELAGLASFRQHQTLYVTAKGGKAVRTQFLATSLAKQIPELEKGDVPLPLLLEVIAKQASMPEGERDPSKRVTILVNVESLMKENEVFDIERAVIRFPSKLTQTALETILDMIGEQIGAMVFVRDNFIEFVGYARACAELKIEYAKEKPLPRLVHRFWTEAPLEQALEQLADRYNQNIVLSPEAKAKRKDFAVTARLLNVPLETAVEIVADLADLKLVRKSNVLMVATKEQAAELNAEQQKRAKAEKKQLEKEKAKEEKLEMSPKK